MKKIMLLLTAMSLFFISCSDDTSTNPNIKDYTIPETYNFENVNYSGQTARLDMISEMDALIQDAKTNGTAIDINKLSAMIRNENNPFTSTELNESGKDIYSKIDPSKTSFFMDLITDMGTINTTDIAEEGKGGLVTSVDGKKSYLVSAKGWDYGEILEKGLMGALMFHQVVGYTSEDKIGSTVDNKTIVPGEGTAMQHHWDEAFGYFGATKDFPKLTEGIGYVAKYANSRNALVGLNDMLMKNGYLKGRAAINNNDDDAKWEAVKEIRKGWELTFVTTAIHYLNSAKANYTDDAMRTHTLSECYGFLWSVQFNPEKNGTIYQDALNRLGDNFWTITIADIDAVKEILANGYNLNNVANDL
jgi:hypothetical protein